MAQSGMETYVGIIRSPADAITLFEACRLGLLPRVCRRLSEKERQQIKSGSVFVWDEREAGMRRWTDGKSWSASRVSGSFLTYREMEGKRSGGNTSFPHRSGITPDGSRGSDDGENGNDDQPDGYRYKPDGLMKQSFSITTSSGSHLHLISYFSRIQHQQQHLKQPTTDLSLRHIKPAPGMYPESSVTDTQSMPAVTRSPMIQGPPSQAPAVAGYARGRHFQPGQPPPGPPPPHQGYPPGAHPPGYGPPPPQVAVNGYGHPHYSPHPPNAYPGYPPHHYGPPPPGPPYVQQGPLGYHQPPPVSQLPPLSGNSTPPSELRSSHRRTGSGSSYQQQYYPSPHTAYTPLTPGASLSSHASQANSPSSTPPDRKPDPRLAVPSPLSQPASQNLHPQYTPMAGPNRSSSPHRTPPTIHPGQHGPIPANNHLGPQLPPALPSAAPMSGTNIPSISSLVNDANQFERAASRPGSRSPGGPYRSIEGMNGDGQGPGQGQRPRDIPHEKLSFGEDRRALNVLNKAFRT